MGPDPAMRAFAREMSEALASPWPAPARAAPEAGRCVTSRLRASLPAAEDVDRDARGCRGADSPENRISTRRSWPGR